ncbi:sulfate ABC transporter substrate-binding protein [Paenibacillus psychroresistens]|uniref:Sulfate ABC transporter substrate-binding protein n=1 Tax=Paenibacillus psychroresistens TaxID=1778678 RepID=A0A6B8RFG0_9BACL|nr:sulfate ABC transporter substrate-binding protein [Paenibacillus psychroresistens]QGQ94106.1 sulfate ABC transporter substrate-binding protein [Paenibacillus psychroresistens]
MNKKRFYGLLFLTAIILVLSACSSKSDNAEAEATKSDYTKAVELNHATTDEASSFFKAIDTSFIPYWSEKTKQTVTIKESLGNSTKQSQAIMDGQLKADVVSLGVGLDIDAIQTKGLIKEGWQQRLENNSSPYTTAIAFVVRKGNPKEIKEWEDLVKPDIQIIATNPKTYSDARWSYLAAWANGLNENGDEEQAKTFVKTLYANVPELYADVAASKSAFLDNNKGDIWITTELEALQLASTTGKDTIEVIVPSITLSVEPIVSVIDSNATSDGTSEVATAYLNFLYTEEAQTIAAKNYYRPRLASVAEQFPEQFPDVTLLTVDDDLGGWDDLQKAHFVDGGIFDQLVKK